jgi:hypothetical protein
MMEYPNPAETELAIQALMYEIQQLERQRENEIHALAAEIQQAEGLEHEDALALAHKRISELKAFAALWDAQSRIIR